MRWTGGASVPLRGFGMYNATRPFATLDVSAGHATLTVRPAMFTRRLPGFPWTLVPSQPHVVYPVRAAGFQQGVGFELVGGRPYYFWCGRSRDEVLAALQEAGFTLDPIQRRPRYRR